MKRLIVGLALSLLGCADDPAQMRTGFPVGEQATTISLAMEAATPLANNRLTLIEGGVMRTQFVLEGHALVARLTDYPSAPAIESIDASGSPVHLNDEQCDALLTGLTVSVAGAPPRHAVKLTAPREPTLCPFN
ncbi:hypothetical protein KBB27_04025 [Patescibacteria group bacterium]|nr:hypothetical protein [Patescibacteria group bacterium]